MGRDVDASDFDEEHSGWAPHRVWRKMLGLLPLDFDRVVTHGDLSLENILIENGQVAGCIDVGRAGIADRYQDLAILWRDLGEFGGDAQRQFLEVYGIGEPEESKMRFHLYLDEFF